MALDSFVGTLTFIRVYSGVLSVGDGVMNTTKSKKERVGRMVQMHSNNREEIKEVRAGDIAACIGLKDITTGDTLSDANKPIVLERMDFPEPVISVAVEPKSKQDQEKMSLALGKLAQEDPSFRVASDEESGQTIISGMGELHLDVLVDRMKREFSVEANIGKPQVAYRETIKETVEIEGKFVRQSAAAGRGHKVGELARSVCSVVLGGEQCAQDCVLCLCGLPSIGNLCDKRPPAQTSGHCTFVSIDTIECALLAQV